MCVAIFLDMFNRFLLRQMEVDMRVDQLPFAPGDAGDGHQPNSRGL